MIYFDEQNRTFFLDTARTTYIIHITDTGLLEHIYYGKKVKHTDISYFSSLKGEPFAPKTVIDGVATSPDTVPMEYPTFGRGDFRQSAIDLCDDTGRNICELKYVDYRIKNGSADICGLPHLQSLNAETLEIDVVDDVIGLKLTLVYGIYSQNDIITRHTIAQNHSSSAIKLLKISSCSIDFPYSDDFEMFDLFGAWTKERSIERTNINHGISSVESRRGASGHQSNPFMALVKPETSEDYGDAYAFALVYSGNFSISAEKSQFNNVRVQAGINPYNFSWNLKAGESFTTPQVVLTYSDNGLSQMSKNLHSVCKEYFPCSMAQKKNRQIVLNNWEATYFDFNEQKLIELIKKCKGLGIDTFVLDDGWFGCRDIDNCSLGDWFVDKRKLPDGLQPVIDACRENGMGFGLWFEPEMISENSELYRNHPDWCIHTKNRKPVEQRNQLVLDFSREEVVNGIYQILKKILSENEIRYVKWDMNRNITDNGSCYLSVESQGEHSHRYILGVYSLLDRLIKKFPNILFEGCSGGGGRFDLGMLYYVPQIWTSDDSDAVERMNIQYGTSYAYPPSSMVGHISACPNHQTGRVTPFETRANIAMLCNFGYELDITKICDEEIELIKKQTETHKRLSNLIENGDFYHLESPFEKNICAWQMVSDDKKKSYAVFARKMSVPNDAGYILKFKGLDSDLVYSVEELGISLSGDVLMNIGVPVFPPMCEYWTCTFEMNAVGDVYGFN